MFCFLVVCGMGRKVLVSFPYVCVGVPFSPSRADLLQVVSEKFYCWFDCKCFLLVLLGSSCSPFSLFLLLLLCRMEKGICVCWFGYFTVLLGFRQVGVFPGGYFVSSCCVVGNRVMFVCS
jgi:hypothetical protein